MHGILPKRTDICSRKLRVSLRFALIDAISPWLVLFFYLTKIDLVWAVNFNFVLLAAYLAVNFRQNMPSLVFNYLIYGAIFLSLIKIVASAFSKQDLMLSHVFSYSYGLIMPLLALSFAKTVSEAGYDKVHEILCDFSLRYFYITVPTVLIYSVLYFTGQVSYFGLGINAHYIYPFFLTGKILPVGFFFVLILLSGKRSVFVN